MGCDRARVRTCVDVVRRTGVGARGQVRGIGGMATSTECGGSARRSGNRSAILDESRESRGAAALAELASFLPEIKLIRAIAWGGDHVYISYG